MLLFLQSELIGGFVNKIVDNLVEEQDEEKLSQLYGALETVYNEEQEEEGLEKRDAADDAYYENLKR